MKSLAQETILITGGTGAIGAAFTQAYLQAGAKVIILGRGRTVPVEEALQSILEKSPAHGQQNLWGFACDVSQEEDFSRLIEKLKEQNLIPTILVNGAGGNKGKSPFIETDVETFREVLDMNLLGGLVVPTKHIARLWIDKGIKGTIINIASMASYLPLSGVWAYGASKSGVMNLTAGLAKEFAPYGIRVNGIAPGFFVGNQNRDLLYTNYEKGELSPRGQQILDHTPMGRFGSLEELQGPLLFLSDRKQSAFVTGVTIPVDGGYLIDNI